MSDVEREQQKHILLILDKAYPAPVFPPALKSQLPDLDDHKLAGLLMHLKELEYVDAVIHISSDGSGRARLVRAQITARGRDYLKEDGGLTAERDALVVKLHADTIRDLILAQIEAAEVEASVKEQLKASVKSLPAKGLEAVVTRLAQEGLARLPNAMQWLQTAISAAP